MLAVNYHGLKIYFKDEESLESFLRKYGISREEVEIILDSEEWSR